MMLLGVSMPVKFLNLTSFGGGGPSKEDRRGGGAWRPSRSGFGGIVCVAMVLSGGDLLQVKRVRAGGWNWRGFRVEIPRVLITLRGAGQLGGLLAGR